MEGVPAHPSLSMILWFYSQTCSQIDVQTSFICNNTEKYYPETTAEKINEAELGCQRQDWNADEERIQVEIIWRGETCKGENGKIMD